MTMTHCQVCKGTAFEPTIFEDSTLVGSVRVAGHVPALRCSQCAEITIAQSDLVAFELRAVAEVLSRGWVGAGPFRAARKVLGFTGSELAALLGVTPETLSRWENGQRDVDRLAWSVVASLVEERRAGVTTTELVRGCRSGPADGS